MPARASLGSSSMPTMAVSMASWFSTRDALAARRITSSLATPWTNTSMRPLSTLSLFSVSVPVLSLQSTSMAAISSIAVIRLVMAPWSERRCEPMAMVTDSTVGMAMGMPPMSSTRRLSMPSR
uniref:Uncharacterized protein n=1 Tax=Oryza glaberrima TaxID=4538 RepID=I1QGT4_ORYGL